MITLSIKHLVAALADAPVFELPKLTSGMRYIQEKICDRLQNGETVKLFDIDFSAFSMDDFDSFKDFHSDMERHGYESGIIAHSFSGLKPAVVPAVFI